MCSQFNYKDIEIFEYLHLKIDSLPKIIKICSFLYYMCDLCVGGMSWIYMLW